MARKRYRTLDEPARTRLTEERIAQLERQRYQLQLDIVIANARVGAAPRPTMIPDNIGSIGRTHGVNERSRPKPKKLRMRRASSP